MESQHSVEFAGVEVVEEDDLLLLCVIAGRRHWISVDRLRPGSTVAHSGDHGVLVLDRQFVAERGFVSSPPRGAQPAPLRGRVRGGQR